MSTAQICSACGTKIEIEDSDDCEPGKEVLIENPPVNEIILCAVCAGSGDFNQL